jgi:hypothetical protein
MTITLLSNPSEFDSLCRTVLLLAIEKYWFLVRALRLMASFCRVEEISRTRQESSKARKLVEEISQRPLPVYVASPKFVSERRDPVSVEQVVIEPIQTQVPQQSYQPPKETYQPSQAVYQPPPQEQQQRTVAWEDPSAHSKPDPRLSTSLNHGFWNVAEEHTNSLGMCSGMSCYCGIIAHLLTISPLCPA